MLGSWRIGRLAGIEISIHWTFLVLVGFVLFSQSFSGAGIVGGVAAVVFLGAVFGCVVLHEMGHALAARQFGISTRGITLLPIGGVAELESIPREPWKELVIAVAGPAVNVVIAMVLLPVVWLAHGMGQFVPVSFGSSFLLSLLLTNFFLVAFNMLPSFPMDGGRVLRSVLAIFMPYLRATRVAVRVGRVMAVLFLVAGFWNPMLLLIALFIFLAGKAELNRLEAEEFAYASPPYWSPEGDYSNKNDQWIEPELIVTPENVTAIRPRAFAPNVIIIRQENS